MADGKLSTLERVQILMASQAFTAYATFGPAADVTDIADDPEHRAHIADDPEHRAHIADNPVTLEEPARTVDGTSVDGKGPPSDG